ncbi:glycogen debranching enzyme [Cyclospora cayetanensis]|uniref:Glycogen debranching enzyme n=1 Tax=Cyclospora cayetanensis TaxID=88456 RepID=A0A6P6RUP7_9EIME|nr:glycogen debranching enzyme [Cyclospora cayetanensis]
MTAALPPDPSSGIRTPCREPEVRGMYYGEFDGEGSLKKPQGSGNFRVKKGDTILLRAYEGTQKLPVAGCTATDPLGKELVLDSSRDTLGNFTFVLQAEIPGPYRLWLTFDASCESGVPSTATSSPSGRQAQSSPSSQSWLQQEHLQQPLRGPHNIIIVEPIITLKGKPIHAEALSVQTVLSRSLGGIKRWWRMFQHTKDMGYNMVHFTPLQTTGESGSCYSLAKQLEIDAFFFREEEDASEAASQGVSSKGTAKVSAASKGTALPKDEAEGLQTLALAVTMLEKELGILSATDLVLNHTANNSEWLVDHPEAGFSAWKHECDACAFRRYNLENSPHLHAAFELDCALQSFSASLARGELRSQFGCSGIIDTEEDLRRALRETGIRRGRPVEFAAGFLSALYPSVHFESEVHGALTAAKDRLLQEARAARANCLSAIEGLVRYERLQCKRGPLSTDHWNALVPRYFTVLVSKETAAPSSFASSGAAEGAKPVALANNGWVMGWDATKDFAAPGSLVYLRRELVVWSDCVKLRYGCRPEDSPFLWEMMEKYCRDTAKIFPAVRLDNCHSTPIHVAAHMLRECRRVRPDIWVYSMQTRNPGDLVWQLTQFGGRDAVGELDSRPAYLQLPAAGAGAAAAVGEALRGEQGALLKPLPARLCPALFYDCTHDNEPAAKKFTPAAALPFAALAAGAAAACGSTRGTDELVPETLSVVHERRLYNDYHPEAPLRDPNKADVGAGTSAKKKAGHAATALEKKEAEEKEDEEQQQQQQREKRTVEITWHGEAQRVVLRGEWDCWQKDVEMERCAGGFRCELREDAHFVMQVGGRQAVTKEAVQYKYVVDGTWTLDPSKPTATDSQGNRNNLAMLPGTRHHAQGMAGMASWHERHPRSVEPGARKTTAHSAAFCCTTLVLGRLRLGVVLCTCVSETLPGLLAVRPTLNSLHIQLSGRITEVPLVASLFVGGNALGDFQPNPARINGLAGSAQVHAGLEAVASWTYSSETGLTTVRLHDFPPGSVAVAFTEPEKRALLQQLEQQLQDTLSRTPALLAPASPAALNSLMFRCNQEETDASGGKRGVYDVPEYGPLVYCGLAGVAAAFDAVRMLLPRDQLQHPLCRNLVDGIWLLEYAADRLTEPTLLPLQQQLQHTVQLLQQLKGYAWIRPRIADRLLSGVYAQVGALVLSRLPAASAIAPTDSSVAAVDPLLLHLLTATLQFYGRVPSSPLVWGTQEPSLCAGLPHFTTGFMRNWGRDTFIAIGGNLIATGRYAEARAEILGYARVLRHGLIPNLLDAGNNPRYNARDATWFFMQGIQDYCKAAPEGVDFLQTQVEPKYGVHASQLPEQQIKTLADVMHHILASHAKGISFREWNAGRQLDEHMQDKGFDIEIRVDPNSGIIYGGNELNCGTWMDKNGSSDKAGNRGFPATPRDGAAIEINGLLKSALRFVSRLPENVFPYKSVFFADGSECMYTRWASLLDARFEKVFYVPLAPEEDAEYFLEPKLINRRGIYKDTHKASTPWADYQLRPNACIALAVAPELFRQDHARSYLHAVEEYLLGNDQLGLKTLDPGDLQYRPDYDNANDSCDKAVAHGWNYHQGPEWVWPLGYFLEAKRLFFDDSGAPAKGPTSPHSGVSTAARRTLLSYLKKHRDYIRTDVWRSLPELTNHSGTYCRDSCQAQAWSVGTLTNSATRSVVSGSPDSFVSRGLGRSSNIPLYVKLDVSDQPETSNSTFVLTGTRAPQKEFILICCDTGFQGLWRAVDTTREGRCFIKALAGVAHHLVWRNICPKYDIPDNWREKESLIRDKGIRVLSSLKCAKAENALELECVYQNAAGEAVFCKSLSITCSLAQKVLPMVPPVPTRIVYHALSQGFYDATPGTHLSDPYGKHATQEMDKRTKTALYTRLPVSKPNEVTPLCVYKP